MVHTKPIPGCEDRNVAFFTQHGMSVSGDTEDAVIQKGLKLLRDPEAQAEMRKCQESLMTQNEFICGQKNEALLGTEGKRQIRQMSMQELGMTVRLLSFVIKVE